MPFFKKDPAPVAAPAPAPAPQPVVVEEKKGLFGRKSTTVRRNSTDSDLRQRSSLASPTSPTHRSPNQRLDEIHSVLPQARERVANAERAEVNARAALVAAEAAVADARKHVKALEQEALLQAKAAEQAARDANAKLSEVSDMKKRTGKMGRV